MSRRLPWRRRAAALAMTLAVTCGGKAAGAEDFNIRPVVSPGELVADHLTRMAIQTLAGQSQPRSDQFARARILLDLAIQLCPDDTQLLRLRAELARRNGDRPALRRMLQRYCRLVPEDDAAQLDLITASLDGRPTLAERAKVVRRLLDEKGADQFTDPLRSRLFSYLAAVAREVGDDEQTLAWIKRAVSLDPSNKEAAVLALRLVESRKAPPLAVGTAMLLLVRADPLDAQSRLGLAQLLLSQGAYADAAEQYEVAERLGADPPAQTAYDRALALTGAGRADDATGLLNEAARDSDESPQQKLAVTDALAQFESAKSGLLPRPLPAGAKLAASLAKWDDMLRRPDPANRPWLQLQIDVGTVRRFGYLDPITATVRIRNAMDMPLAIGPGQAIRSPLLVRTSVTAPGEPIEDPQTLVVDLRRRLRLDPNSEIELPVRLDRGALGAVLAHFPAGRFSISAGALLDPMTNRDGEVTVGPCGAVDTVPALERRGLSETDANIAGWLDDVGRPLPSAVKVRSMIRLVRLAGDATEPKLRSRIVEKVNRALPSLDRPGRALLVLLTPTDDKSKELRSAVLAEAAASDDTLVRVCHLARHVRQADSPHIQAALDSDDPVVAGFARAMAESLRRE